MARQATESAQIEAAIAAVQSGSMALREAARKFDVPRTTLQRRVQRRASEASESRASEDVRVRQESVPGIESNAQSDTSNEDTAENTVERREAGSITGHKRSASHLETHSQGEGLSGWISGPRKVINCKIRMLCTAAGSALDELSNKMIREGKCIYKLGLGQSPFPIPQCIVDELRANSHRRDYLPVAGLPELCDDIAAWGTDRLHINYSRDDVLVGPGTKELLFVLQTTYCCRIRVVQAKHHKPLLLEAIDFLYYTQRNMMWLPTHAEDHFVLRPEVLEEHCAKDPDAPRILILNSPSNPTGCAYQPDE
ncbi:Aspartate aminotransferase, partial [Phytophthora palmivora]